MKAIVLQSIQNSKKFDKSAFIEMDNAPASKEFSFGKSNFQSKHTPYNITETPEMSLAGDKFKGSLASLESRFADQSEVQPLTQTHLCSYDECHKFRNSKLTKEKLESPASPLKTVFLYLVIILLILWIIIYTLLNQFVLL